MWIRMSVDWVLPEVCRLVLLTGPSPGLRSYGGPCAFTTAISQLQFCEYGERYWRSQSPLPLFDDSSGMRFHGLLYALSRLQMPSSVPVGARVVLAEASD
jgi:hypothetical protein